MEYQKMINLLDNTSNQPTKFRTKKQIEINACGKYNTNSQIKFKTSMLQSNFKTSMLCDYSDEYVVIKRNYISPKHGRSRQCCK